VFLDRDGVLVEDRGLVVRASQLRVLAGVPQALARLKDAGFRLVLVSNQAVVARGLLTEQDLQAIHGELGRMLQSAGAPALDAVCCCPHHPEADVAAYRIACQCRKPRPGLLLRAAAEHALDLPRSFLVGDRMTDVAAGRAAGCRTVLVRSSATDGPAIVTADPLDPALQPDCECDGLTAAADWILAASLRDCRPAEPLRAVSAVSSRPRREETGGP
jgi:D-glycero-D-manno-heptose 1,7-bisphosphate phosphatase